MKAKKIIKFYILFFKIVCYIIYGLNNNSIFTRYAMKYFCKEEDRNGTDYHEFQKGKWYKQTHFDSHSILIRDDLFREIGLKSLCEKCIPEYDYYSGSVITEATWKKMLKEAKKQGGALEEALLEAEPWAKDNFLTEESFSILGI